MNCDVFQVWGTPIAAKSVPWWKWWLLALVWLLQSLLTITYTISSMLIWSLVIEIFHFLIGHKVQFPIQKVPGLLISNSFRLFLVRTCRPCEWTIGLSIHMSLWNFRAIVLVLGGVSTACFAWLTLIVVEAVPFQVSFRPEKQYLFYSNSICFSQV